MTERTPVPATPRFAQLTFASADRAGRSGGWQVQETRGGLSAAERTFLTGGIVPRLPDGEPIPPFPSAAEIARLPRRLTYGVRDGIGGAWWHTAPCGSDSQGRPGNVFVHAVLDRAAAGPHGGRLRPSDLCGGDAGWLCPYGHAEVVATSLDSVPELPWPPVPDRAAVLDFVRRRSQDVGVLCVLLDALAGALSGGPPVALGVRDLRSAPDWVAAVCHLMSPGTARRLTWSTWNRAAELTGRSPGAHLTVVPYDDLPVLGNRVVGLVEDEVQPPRGWGGSAWVTSNGAEVAVTPWSELFYEVSRPNLLPGVLAEADRLVTAVVDAGLDPAWPLALVVAKRSAEFGDAARAAREVLESHGPARLGVDQPELYRHVLDLVGAQTGPGLAAAWSSVLAADDTRVVVRADVFLIRALVDPSWRDVTGATPEATAPLRPATPPALAVREAAAAGLDAVRARLAPERPPDVEAALAVVRLAELHRAARIDLEPAVTELYDEVVLPVLLDPAAGSAFARAPHGLGTVSEAVAARVSRALADASGEPGTLLPPAVLRLLGVRLPRPKELGPGRPDPLERELAAQLTLVDPDPWSRAWLVRAWTALDESDPTALDALVDAGRDTRHQRGATGWDGSGLAALLAHPHAHRLTGTVIAALLGLPPGPGAGALVTATRRHLAPDPATLSGQQATELRAALRLRELTAEPAGAQILDVAAQVLGTQPADRVDPEIRTAVLAACLGRAIEVAWSRYPRPAPAEHVLAAAQGAGRDRAGRERLARLLAADASVPGAALAYAALLLRRSRANGATEPVAESAAVTELRRVTALVPEDHSYFLVERAAALRVRDGRLADDEIDAVRARLREAARAERGRGRRMFGDRGGDGTAVDELAVWWQEVVTDSVSGPVRRLPRRGD